MAIQKHVSILRQYVDWFWRVAERRWPKWYLQREIDRLSRPFDTEITTTKDRDDQRNLAALRDSICSPLENKIERIKSLELTKRAERVLVGLDEIPLPEGETSHWTQGDSGTRFLDPKSFRALARRVQDAEYEREKRKREEREAKIKLYTATAATVAAVTGFLNLLLKH